MHDGVENPKLVLCQWSENMSGKCQGPLNILKLTLSWQETSSPLFFQFKTQFGYWKLEFLFSLLDLPDLDGSHELKLSCFGFEGVNYYSVFPTRYLQSWAFKKSLDWKNPIAELGWGHGLLQNSKC